MKQKISVILLLLMLSIPLNAKEECLQTFSQFLDPNKFFFKSINGWTRVFSSREKSKNYGLNENKRLILLKRFEECESLKSNLGVIQ